MFLVAVCLSFMLSFLPAISNYHYSENIPLANVNVNVNTSKSESHFKNTDTPVFQKNIYTKKIDTEEIPINEREKIIQVSPTPKLTQNLTPIPTQAMIKPKVVPSISQIPSPTIDPVEPIDPPISPPVTLPCGRFYINDRYAKNKLPPEIPAICLETTF